jgi:hypothetical protein
MKKIEIPTSHIRSEKPQRIIQTSNDSSHPNQDSVRDGSFSLDVMILPNKGKLKKTSLFFKGFFVYSYRYNIKVNTDRLKYTISSTIKTKDNEILHIQSKLGWNEATINWDDLYFDHKHKNRELNLHVVIKILTSSGIIFKEYKELKAKVRLYI